VVFETKNWDKKGRKHFTVFKIGFGKLTPTAIWGIALYLSSK
jgi:hypothetical protein